MRVAVAGGTGLAGRHTVRALQESGHEPVILARSTGVDVLSGSNLDTALAWVETVIDVTSTATLDPSDAHDFFDTVTERLLQAEHRAGVQHHVVLSIMGSVQHD